MDVLKKVWEKVDGKKTLTGIGVCVGAVICDALGLETAAQALIAAGVPMFVGGVFHKILKQIAAKQPK